MDSPVGISRQAACTLVFLRCQIPAAHPSAAILGEERFGSGIAVAPGRVLTAHYLVLGAETVAVTAIDGTVLKVHRVVVDHDSGLALLHVDDAVPVAPMRTDVATPGTPIFILALTSEGERRGASGHVTTVSPFEAFWEYMLDEAIMTTAVNPGLAGAGLFDGSGRLAGVVSLGLGTVARYSLAIPVTLYLTFRQDLEQGARAPARPRRAWVGFFPQGITDGVVVTGLVPGGPAERAGLERGDVVLSLDGAPVSSLRELYAALWRKRPGESLGVQVLRADHIHTLDVIAADRDEFYR